MPHHLWDQIRNNSNLGVLELAGFIKGDICGKTMDVDSKTIFNSLDKQWWDFLMAWNTNGASENIGESLANLRNVAGLLFVKLEEEEEEKKQTNGG